MALAIATNRKASKSYQLGEFETREVENIKMAAAREKHREANRKIRIKMLKRRSFCSETVE